MPLTAAEAVTEGDKEAAVIAGLFAVTAGLFAVTVGLFAVTAGLFAAARRCRAGIC